MLFLRTETKEALIKSAEDCPDFDSLIKFYGTLYE